MTGFETTVAKAKSEVARYKEMQQKSNHPEWYADDIKSTKGRLKDLRRLRKLFGELPHVKAMTEIVEKVVEAYHADFYFYDLSAMEKYPNRKFLWTVGDCGTHYVFLEQDSEEDAKSSKDLIRALMKTYGHYTPYIVDPVQQTVKKSTYEKALGLVKVVEPTPNS